MHQFYIYKKPVDSKNFPLYIYIFFISFFKPRRFLKNVTIYIAYPVAILGNMQHHLLGFLIPFPFFLFKFLFWIKEMHSFPPIVSFTNFNVGINNSFPELTMYKLDNDALYKWEYHYFNTNLFWITHNMIT